MSMHKRAKIMVAAVSAAGVVGVLGLGGAAFTATGLNTSGQAAAPQIIGGTISQAVSGENLSGIVYTYTDTTNTAINLVTLTFADSNADTLVPTIAFAAGTPVAFTCSVITSSVSTCSPSVALTSQTGTTGITVTVPSTNAS
jgi:hypothetical protein